MPVLKPTFYMTISPSYFDMTPDQQQAYKKSLKGVVRTKTKFKQQLKNIKDKNMKLDREYKIELLNAIEGYMRIVLQKGDTRLGFTEKVFQPIRNKKH